MAQKRKRNRSKKWLSWVILLLLLIVAGVIVYLVWDSYFRDKKENDMDDQGVEQVEERGEEKKKEKENDGDVTGKEKVEQYDGEDPNNAEVLSGVVTYAGVNGDKMMIRVNIDQYLEGGECSLTLSRGGATLYSDESNVVGSASTSTCEGFDVPLDRLGEGMIDISIRVNSGERSGMIHGEVSV